VEDVDVQCGGEVKEVEDVEDVDVDGMGRAIMEEDGGGSH